MSNFVSGSNTLKYDDVISVILSDETHRKTSGWYTLGSALNAQSRVWTTKRGLSKIVGNQEESQRGGGLNPKDWEIASTMVI